MLDGSVLSPVIFLAAQFDTIAWQDVCRGQMGIIEVLVTPEKELNCARVLAWLLLVLLWGKLLGLVLQKRLHFYRKG